jgi:putative ABC transport system permease protein
VRSLQMAVRSILSAPWTSSIVVATLALGVGANVAVFGVVNSLLLRSLPVAEPDRLVTVSSDFAIGHGFKAGVGWKHAMWTRLDMLMKGPAPPFDGVLAWAQPSLDVSPGGERQPVNGLVVSGSFFEVLRVPAHVGRTIVPADDRRGGGADGLVAVISDRFWERRFNRRTDAVGRSIALDGVPFTIVGVAPSWFLGLEVGQAFDVAIPLGAAASVRSTRSLVDDSPRFGLTVMLRLKPDQSVEQATAAMRALQPAILGVAPEKLADVRPPFLREPYVVVPSATGISDFSRLRTRYQGSLMVLLGLVGLVLLIACLNIATVMLARANARRYEIGVRMALGATRAQLWPQLLLESLLLSAAGSAIGLVFASWGSALLVGQLSRLDAQIVLELEPDAVVIGFTAVLASFATILFGLAPALHATRVRPITAQRGRAGARGEDGAAGPTSVLIAAQVSLSVVLVLGAALFMRTFERLVHAPLGFDADRVLLASIDTGRVPASPEARTALYQGIADAIARVPGVERAAPSTFTPLSGATRAPLVARAEHAEAVIGPGWLETYGTRLIAGRGFSPGDTATSATVAIVNQSYVRRFLPDTPPIGHVVGGRTIVGVAADAVFASVRGGPKPTIYRPLTQAAGTRAPDNTTITVSIRAASGAPTSLIRPVAAAAATVDPRLTFTFATLEKEVGASIAQERVLASIAGVLGVLALLLAALGLFGLTAYAVNRRRFELGVRIALGAPRRHILAVVVTRSVAVTGAGLAVGTPAALAGGRYVEAMLYGVTLFDPWMVPGVVALLAAVAIAGALMPARTAVAIDPLLSLRSE